MSESVDLDRLVSRMAVRENNIRRLAYSWMGSVDPELRDYTVSAENLAAVGYYLLMAVDHPEELGNLKLTVLPYDPQDEE